MQMPQQIRASSLSLIGVCCRWHAVDAVAEYGVRREGSGCELSSWLVPEGCLLPVPFPVTVELGRWERQSQNLTANAESQMAFEGGLGCGLDCMPVPAWLRCSAAAGRLCGAAARHLRCTDRSNCANRMLQPSYPTWRARWLRSTTPRCSRRSTS